MLWHFSCLEKLLVKCHIHSDQSDFMKYLTSLWYQCDFCSELEAHALMQIQSLWFTGINLGFAIVAKEEG